MSGEPNWPPYVKPGLSGTDRVGALLLTDTKPQAGGPPPMLEGLSERQIAEVIAIGRQRSLPRGATLFSQGTPHDGIYLVESGRVRVFYTAPSGREITLAIWHPGNFVGGPEVFGGGPHVWSGVAVTNVNALHLPGAALRDLVVEIPSLAIGIIEGLAFKGKCYSAMAQMLGTRSVTERLAHLLLHLSELYGMRQRDGILIATRFTHEDIAHMVGATRQWVTMSLRRLHLQGVVIVHKGNLTIAQPATLASIRDGSPIC